MGKPLTWRPGEGYDIHLLRDGPPSKRLIDAIDPGEVQPNTIAFVPSLAAGSDVTGVVIDAATGVVQAGLHPDPTQPKPTNFLLSIVGSLANGDKSELIVRIHLHDQLDRIQLTPSSLTIHKDANECRFTVLATFRDVGFADITDWTQLSYKCVEPNTSPPQDSIDVLISPAGVLTTVMPGKSAIVTAAIKLDKASDPTAVLVDVKSDPVTVFAKESWSDTAATAEVIFVGAGLRSGKDEKGKPRILGTVVPNKDDPESDKRDSVKSVVENALNILFVAEGFRQDQRGDFNDFVWKIVEHLRTDDSFLPFKLLKDSVNYWSAFIPSQDGAVSLLGDYYLGDMVPNRPKSWTAGLVPQPKQPDTASTDPWSLEEMIYEVGVPSGLGPEPSNLQSLVQDYWQKIFGDHVTEDRVRDSLAAWQGVGWHGPLGEHNTAFGIKNYDRPRASSGAGGVDLGSDSRRTSDAHINEFLISLNYGKNPSNGDTYNLGAVWRDDDTARGKDAGFVCFICLTEKHSGHAWGSYFLSSTGRSGVTVTSPQGLNFAMEIDTPPVETMGRTLLAAVVSHEFGHLLGLADEYGDGNAFYSDVDHPEPNLQPKHLITSQKALPGVTGPKIVYDKTNDIKWLWPRIAKAGALQSPPGRSVTGFFVPLRKGHSKAFAVGDLVRFRQWPVHDRASADPFVSFQKTNGFIFKVKLQDDNGVGFDIEDGNGNVVDVSSPNPGNPDPRSWGDILLSLFAPGAGYTVICPLTGSGASGNVELRVLSEFIRNRIVATNGALNAPTGNEAMGFETASCTPNYADTMTPTNLQPGFKLPRGLASAKDLIGIYEGGGGHDCGVFRPAGRCKMRDTFDTTIPFCHVCRYVIVDKINPTRHPDLDRIYATQYPT